MALFASVTVEGCLPSDSRPLPGRLALSVSPSRMTREGFVTGDGWTIGFSKVLLGIGETSLSDACVRYGSASYDRILNLMEGTKQKLSLLHGVGRCDVRLRVMPPTEDTVLGMGVSDQDKLLMRSPDTQGTGTRSGIALKVLGTAQKENRILRFAWDFRQRVRYQKCSTDELPGLGVVLESGANRAIDITFELERLFQNGPFDGASLRFNDFADADKNGDGEVTLSELKGVPLQGFEDGGPFQGGSYSIELEGPGSNSAKVTVDNLRDYVVVVLMPGLLRFGDNGSCSPRLQLQEPPDR